MITGKFLTSMDDTSLIMDIRRQVFNADGERDWRDDMAIYAVAFTESHEAGACGRLYMDDDSVATIDCVCTLEQLRNRGLGDLVMRMLLYRVLEMKLPCVKLTSPVKLTGFYARYGLKASGEIFTQRGLPCVNMQSTSGAINIEGSCRRCAQS